MANKLEPDRRSGYKDIGVVEGYDKWALTYDCAPNPLIAVEEPVTLELIGDVKGQRVLDIGCGTGRYCALLADRGADVVGIDPSPVMVEQARKKFSPRRQFGLIRGTLTETGLHSGQFDLILSALTFGHIPKVEPVFEGMNKVLKHGGRIVISDFHAYWPVFGYGYTEFFDEKGQEYRIISYPHLFDEYFALCRKFGLRIEDVREPKITGELVKRFPYLKDYRGLPLALILKLSKPT